MKFLFLIIFWSCNFSIYAQTQLNWTDYLALVKKNHPLAVNARLQLTRADIELQESRGLFDPKFESDFSSKFFKGKNYFTLLDVSTKVPTWFGTDFKLGLESNSGAQLNPEELTPEKGLFYAGINVPLAQNLIIDQRRAELKQAKLGIQASPFEVNSRLNQLLFDAGKAYWEWALADTLFFLQQNLLNLAEKRYLASIEYFKQGVRPAIDTIEALSQLQMRQLEFQNANIALNNAKILASIYLWNEKQEPVELEDNVHPIWFQLSDFPQAELTNIEETHPDLVLYKYKLLSLNIDKKLKINKLLPKINVSYNQLVDGSKFNYLFSSGDYYFTNNYKWGLSVSMPLFLRAERSQLRLAQLKILETNNARTWKNREITAKIATYENNFQVLSEQNILGQNLVKNYNLLFIGEQKKWEIGESTLFILNSRENKFLEGQQKLLEIQSKLAKARMGTYYSAGVLSQMTPD